MTLTSALDDPERKKAVIADAERFIDQEVASKGGLSGAALRAGYKAFLKLKPNMVRGALRRLLPEFAPVLEPHWERAVSSGDPRAYFRDRDGEVADALLGVTDGVADRATNKVVLRLYRSLRGTARDHVRAAVPRIPDLIEPHVHPTGPTR